MPLKKCFLLATAFSLLLVAIISVTGADRVILAGPNGQSATSTSTPPVNVVGSDPRDYTVDYVERAIDLYDQRGLETMKSYYNSDDSFEGEWYLFAIDENDIYVVHPLFPRLIDTDIKEVVDSSGYELGKDIAKATEEGRWIEYLWPHPVTLTEVPKVSYAKRHDGYIFASGYYPVPDDPAEYTQAYVQKAIDLYDRNGLDATATYYSRRASLDNQWYLVMASVADETVIAHGLYPSLVGTNAADLNDPEGFNIGQALLAAPEMGYWFQMAFFSNTESGFNRINVWAIQHDGYIFASGYFTGLTAPATPTPVSSPTPTSTPVQVEITVDEDPFRFLIAVLNDAYEDDRLSDVLSGLLANMFIDSLTTSQTGETREEVRHRLVVEGPLADKTALVALYNATGGPNWDKSDNWMSDEPVSEWYGVTTDLSGRVTELELVNNNLTGTLPVELDKLSSLTNLNLRDNSLSGQIIPELGNLPNLTELHLYGNDLSGELPPELANLTNLQKLLVWSNNLSGPIPSWLEELTNLTRLDLDDNAFTGEIPPELGNLQKLQVLWLARNQLSGAIPPELGNLSKLDHLFMYENQLSGPIPPELGSLTELRMLYLYDTNLSGEIPAELGNLENLERLYLSDNELTGAIPPELGNLTNLDAMSLSYNELSGEIPAELGNLENIAWLSLTENMLTGAIPPELGNLSSVKDLFLRNNQLSGSIPPELGNLSNLEILSIRNNALTGMIPAELGNLANLEGMTISNNDLTGEIPSELGNLTKLDLLYINGNQLTGCIPAELRDISDNDFMEIVPPLPFCGDSEEMEMEGASSSSSAMTAYPIPMYIAK